MDLAELIARYDRRVPRYTSYPTAPHFSAAVDSTTYREWLRRLAADAPVSLYLHVPFCAALCRFCACHTTVARHAGPLIAYAQNLLTEIDMVAATIGPRLPVSHIHWGGGTPTSLPPGSMLAVMQRLRQCFQIEADAEIAVEVDPRTLSDQSVQALGAMGTTRVSLGVQDFDPMVQQAINRIQSFETTASCARRLRAIGIFSLNLDLIYGLPHQTTEGVTATVREALQLEPDRVAVFGYAHVPWMKRHQALLPEAALPGPLERYAQREAVDAVMAEHGYTPIGLDHFARDHDTLAHAAHAGRLRRNFQGYTTDAAPVLIGLGASSIGALPDGYVQNAASVPVWRDMLHDGRLPVVRGVALSAEDRLRRNVIERIMCDLRIDLSAVDSACLSDAAPVLEACAQDGLIEWNDRHIAVTPRGRPFVRAVAAAFDAYLQPAETRHSAAI